MKHITGNIFNIKDADAICVPTNGIVKANGELVMGAGLALQFKNKYLGLAYRLGKKVKKFGNRVNTDWVSYDSRTIVSFPTKHDWREPSDLDLIVKSAVELAELAEQKKWTKVVLPRVGTGLGQLPWEQVKAVLEPILDDRFLIITPEEVR